MREAEPIQRLVPAEQTRCGECEFLDSCPQNNGLRGELVPTYFAERCHKFMPKLPELAMLDEIEAKQP